MEVRTFDELQLSPQTQRGLRYARYTEPTLIQKLALQPALKGSDVAGAAKTGCGKTLAYLIPLLEKLKSLQWTRECGVGAVVVTPTRELCAQIFFVLKKIGRFHPFSAGAAFGGNTPTALRKERKVVGNVQILLATPGRLLDHLESGYLQLDNLQLLVIDEADKLLELGFREQVDRLLTYLPASRQTLLFSATLSRSTKDLSRVIMQSKPVFVQTEIVDNNKDHIVMPAGLQQFYVVSPLQEKLNVLWSFAKSKTDKKSIVFLDTCKQVQFVYEVFRQLKSRASVLRLHGKMKQNNRLDAYKSFQRKHSVILFSTDVAARGLDFPNVDWVFQFDAPTDPKTYIHRAGRTARYKANGQVVTLLLPQEEKAFLDKLAKFGITVRQINVRPDKLYNAVCKLPSKVAVDRNDIRGMAERAFTSYLREFCFFRPRSDPGYDPTALDVDAFARSLGLLTTPRLSKKLSRILGRTTSEAPPRPQETSAELLRTEEPLVASEEESELEEDGGSGDDLQPNVKARAKTKREVAKTSLRKAERMKVKLHANIKFDDSEDEDQDAGGAKEPEPEEGLGECLNLDEELRRLQAEDEPDRAAFRNRERERKREEKERRKLRKAEAEEEKRRKRRRWLGLPDQEALEDDAPRLPGGDDEPRASSDLEAAESEEEEEEEGEDEEEEEDEEDEEEEKEEKEEAVKDNVTDRLGKRKRKSVTHDAPAGSKRLRLSDLEAMALDMSR